MEQIARFPGGEIIAESCHVSDCHGFLGPDPFLYRFTVLLNSGGSNSPWSEFWSEFPGLFRHFMGMGVVPAPSNFEGRNTLFWKAHGTLGVCCTFFRIVDAHHVAHWGR